MNRAPVEETEWLEEYFRAHPEIAKIIKNILIFVLCAIIFINFFVFIPLSLFQQYSLNFCSWSFDKFILIFEPVVLIINIFLIIAVFLIKNDIGFHIVNEDPTKKLCEFRTPIDWIGGMSLPLAFLSIIFYLGLWTIVEPELKQYILPCASNISKAPEMLSDTPQKKIYRKNETRNYTVALSESFNNNWNPPSVKKNTLTEIKVRIFKDGKILKTEIEESSKNNDFDKSALKAVESVKKYKPLPEVLKVDYIDFLFGFEIYRGGKVTGEYTSLCKTCENPYVKDGMFY